MSSINLLPFEPHVMLGFPLENHKESDFYFCQGKILLASYIPTPSLRVQSHLCMNSNACMGKPL